LSSSFAIREVELVQFAGEPFLLAYQPPAAGQAHEGALPQRIVSLTTPERGTFSRFPDAQVAAIAHAAMPGQQAAAESWLARYDAYYYDRDGALALPVLRLQYADAHGTWLYVDPFRGAVARKEERLTRLNRWLYHGLHSLDFPFLYYRRPLWDIVLVVLSIGGIISAGATITPALRRLRRHVRRLRRHADVATDMPLAGHVARQKSSGN
jgi:hypothetical protein